jgi:DNA-binding GntR family transcriptional regulator
VRGDDPEVAAANSAFHRVLVEVAANPLLSVMMGPLAARVQWLFHLTRRRDLVLQCEEHQDI